MLSISICEMYRAKIVLKKGNELNIRFQALS